MAQGLVKKPSSNPKSTSSTGSGATKTGAITKRGSRQINPKKSRLIKQAKINKKFTSGLTAQTERMLGEKAGHLEMLGQGKKRSSTTTSDGVKSKHGKKNAGKRS